MPVYRYQAIDSRGRNLAGMMPATDESNLEGKLKALGLWLTEAAMERVGADKVGRGERSWLRLRGKKQRRELIDFCTLMTFQVRVGIPLVKALEVACQDCKDEDFRKVLQGLQGH